MNKTQTQIIRNENYRLVDTSKTLGNESNHPIMRYNYNNTFEHEAKKLKICMELKSQGHNLLTECWFKEPFSGRADIFDLTTGEIIEILSSETKERFEKKVANYPPVKIIKVYVKVHK